MIIGISKTEKEDAEMVTKEQERKALEQIRKIVAGLGKDSYIGTAFEGCFEIAEENIENDFACSMKQRAEDAEAKIRGLCEVNRQLKLELKTRGEHEAKLDGQIEKLTARRDELFDEVKEAADKWSSTYGQFREQEARAIKAEEEIIRLKAKLYDLMIKEA